MANGGARPGAGRKPGSKGKRTHELIASLGEGLSPVEFMVRTLRDESADPEARQWAAEKAAPYFHAKPMPEPRYIELELPKTDTAEGVRDAFARIAEATAAGEIAPADALSLVGIIEAQRRAIETVDLQQRLDAIEEQMAKDAGRPAQGRSWGR